MNETINIVILGSGGVNKAAIALRYLKGKYIESYIPFFEEQFEKTVTIEGKTYKIEVSDTTGQEDFKDLIPRYIREGDCFMLVYAVDNVHSFDYLQDIYFQILSVKRTLPPCIIVGNKFELPLPHAVTLEKARTYSSQHFQNIPVLEVSPKTNKNIDESFDIIIRIYISQNYLPSIAQSTKEEKEEESTVFLKKYYKFIKKHSQQTATKYTIFSQKTFNKVFNDIKNDKHIINFLMYSLIYQNQLLIFSNKGHQTNIFKAIQQNDIACVKFLIENDFHSVYEVNKLGTSLITYCLECGREYLYNYLLSNQTPFNYFEPIKDKPKDFESDIFMACGGGKLTSVQWLIEKEKVNKNIRNDNNLTLIHSACIMGHLPIVQYLIEIQNIDKDFIDFDGRTLLHYACYGGYLPIVVYLISKGSNIEAKDNNGWTPLFYALGNEQDDVVDYLISKGASKEQIDLAQIEQILQND